MKKILPALTGVALVASALVVSAPAQANSPEPVFMRTPTVPTMVMGVGGVRSGVVSWQPPAIEGGSAITSYHIFVSRRDRSNQDGTFDVSFEYPATARSARVRFLRPGWTYRVYVSARNAKGRGGAQPVLVTVKK